MTNRSGGTIIRPVDLRLPRDAPTTGFVSSVQRMFGGPAPQNGKGSPIVVRRFAGPADYCGVMQGLRVAHVTDLHFGRVTPLSVQHRAVELINQAHPDVVVLTGDFVCHSQLYLDQLTEALSRIAAPAFAVLGNHDHWSGGDEVAWALRRAGVELLANAHTVIERRHQRLQIVGVDDAYTGHADVERAVKGLRRDLPTIALSHIAEEADHLWSRHVPLVLSGHTHAGQVTLAGLHEWTLGRLAGHRYVHGLYGSRGSNGGGAGHGPPAPAGAVYVGAGIGASVIPLRFGDRGQREIALFDLGAEPGSLDEHHGEQAPLEGRKPSEKTKYKRAAKVVARRLARERGSSG